MKRFTDTNIWKKVWFQELSPEYKTAWFYIKDNCDSVGIWDVNIPLATFQIGSKIDWKDFIDNCNGNIYVLSDSKWWLIDFCRFQYGQLSESSNSKPIISYILLLKKHRLWKAYTEGINTLKEKEKDKEQEKEQEKDAGKKKKSNSEKDVHPLYEPIKEAFLSKNNDVFSNWAKEGTAIKQLIKKAEARFPEDPEAFIKTVMEKYYKLISNNNDKYWSGHPFTPSSLNSSGIFDRVLKQLEITESTNLDNCDFTKTVPEGMF